MPVSRLRKLLLGEGRFLNMVDAGCFAELAQTALDSIGSAPSFSAVNEVLRSFCTVSFPFAQATASRATLKAFLWSAWFALIAGKFAAILLSFILRWVASRKIRQYSAVLCVHAARDSRNDLHGGCLEKQTFLMLYSVQSSALGSKETLQKGL
jgi:hypothetical protein